MRLWLALVIFVYFAHSIPLTIQPLWDVWQYEEGNVSANKMLKEHSYRKKMIEKSLKNVLAWFADWKVNEPSPVTYSGTLDNGHCRLSSFRGLLAGKLDKQLYISFMGRETVSVASNMASAPCLVKSRTTHPITNTLVNGRVWFGYVIINFARITLSEDPTNID